MRNLLRSIVLLLLLCGFAIDKLHAQQGLTLINGTVTDEEGETLVGVYIRVKEDNKRGVASDKDGKFSIRAKDTETLIFTLVGYQQRQILVKNLGKAAIKLKTDPTSLNEVVIIGYGQVNKQDLTGSVGQVKVEEITKAPVTSFEEALAGRVAGVQVTSNSGQPGDEINITIRGGNSITQSNAPLYVVDGFPIEDFNANSINPDEIESISVLKDASATAIYGTRGANGVIILETKKGKIGKPQVSYNGFVGLHQATKKMDLMNPYEFVKYQLERDFTEMSDTYLTRPNLTLEDYKNADPIDWQDNLFTNGWVQNHSLSLRGGTAQTKYAVSGNFVDQNGVIINSGLSRQQFRVVLDQAINKNLKFSLNASYARDKNYGQTVASQANSANAYATYLMYRVWGYRPLNTGGVDLFEDLFDEDISNESILVINPIVSTKNEIRQQTRTTLNFNGGITYDFLKDFRLNIRGGFNSRLTRNENFNNSKTYRGVLTANNLNGVNGSIYNQTLNDWVNENTLTYKKKINRDHQFDILVGATVQGNNFDENGFFSTNVPREELGLRALQYGIPKTVSSSARANTLLSFLGRANYNYKSKYLFTVSFRADGSSKFSENNRWAYFPSGAFAWNLNKEKFMKNLKFISNTKLRLSYGVTGNNRINDFSRLQSLDILDYYATNGGAPLYAILPDNLGNADITWEKTSQFDAGLELGLFKDRINLTVDAYHKVTDDLLLNANIGTHNGYNTLYKNIGKIQNRGLEFTLTTVNVRNKKFSWTTDFNISFNRNKVLELTDGQSSLLSAVTFTGDYNGTSLYIAKVGQPVASFYGMVWDGNYQYDDFIKRADGTYLLKGNIATNGNARNTIQPGDIKYVDQNGDGEVNDLDMVVIGRALPIHTGGFNNNFTYKNFSLSVFLQWSYGNNIMNANRLMLEGNPADRPNLNQFASYNDRWTPENQNNTYYRIGGAGPRGVYSTRTLEDGSFLRLKTVQLSYNLPNKLIKKISSLQLYASAQNLFTWSSYSGMDPEVSTKNSILTPGFDYSAYARNRILTMGLKVAF
ncbi:SusC/RagA family TonB-linked outer membrane protein [Nubsella zeaxanthinifaciens]|uniref:SusC/RagA family TonB-linked outer membrane protein n=1 Tax=Nubsella zeaxanthinifaciens TaxID=392412 RepID=UPI000DE226E3|nr:TonB-dependent receptor [Nubsella zeaxanthinifaciens]